MRQQTKFVCWLTRAMPRAELSRLDFPVSLLSQGHFGYDRSMSHSQLVVSLAIGAWVALLFVITSRALAREFADQKGVSE